MRQMKDSRIEWIEGLPESWREIPNRYLFVDNSTKVGENWKNYQLLSLTTSGVKQKDPNVGGGKVPESYETYQTVQVGDMVFCLFDLDCSAVFSGLSNYDGMITSAYDVFMPNGEYLDSLYADYWFQYVFSNRYYNMYSKNLRYTITSEMFKSIFTPIPSLTEQRKIGEFLLRKDKQISELIANQQAQIEKLKEYKQSIITEAVTKGLDQSAPMKDSGIAWIGEVPAHWDVKRTKFLAKSFSKGSGITKDDVVFDGDSPCVRYGEIYTKYNTYFDTCVTRTNLSNVVSPQYFSYGDILFVCTGELVEEIGKNVVYLGKDDCLAGGDIIIMKHNHNPLFLSFALDHYISQCQKSCNKAKLKVVHISAGDIGNVFICIPPIIEQQQIAEYLKQKCDYINAMIAIKQQKIEKLQEYKKSLIYEYVTGKKEVV